MSNEWQVVEGTGWIDVPGFGQINPRRDGVGGGREYFTAKTTNDEYARVTGKCISGGPETWHYESDEPFFLADRNEQVLETMISLLVGGRYAVKYRPGAWPGQTAGGWATDD